MIIEIRDIPKSKTISHINIDITFDDNTENNVKVISDSSSDSTLESSDKGQAEEIHEIPEEMMDGEF